MPHLSLRQIATELESRRSTSRFVDALLVVQGPSGDEIFRVGGRWDRRLRCWVRGATGVRETVRRVKKSQVDAAQWTARYLKLAGECDRARQLGLPNPHPDLDIVLMLAGDRGSGKTHYLAGFVLVAFALRWPGEWQFGVNITSKQRRECIEAIEETAEPEWIERQVEDLREPYTQFLTGSRVAWMSSKNPRALRMAKLRVRHVLVNEAQDQPEKVYFNSLGATRNVDGLTSIATNRPQEGMADWVAIAANDIEAGETKGRVFFLDPKLNDAVSSVALDKRTAAIRAVSRQAAEADGGGGGMKLSGPIAYPNFRALALDKGGHLFDPPPRPLLGIPLWEDVTRERTAEKMGGGEGFDSIIGADFQRRPGIVGIDCRLYRVRELLPNIDPRYQPPVGTLVLWAARMINCAGDETAFSDALEQAGYSPTGETVAGRRTLRSIIVGDGTGAKQNAAHRWELPPSFRLLTNYGGWNVIPPHKSRKGRPINPRVPERRAHMYKGFDARQIIISPSLKEPDGGFASLIESLQRAKVTSRGGLMESGGWQHGPDGLGYAAFAFLPQPGPPPSQGLDDKTFDALSSIRVFNNG